MSDKSPNLKIKLLIGVDDLVFAFNNIDDLLKYITKLVNFCVQLNFEIYNVKFRVIKLDSMFRATHLRWGYGRMDSSFLGTKERDANYRQLATIIHLSDAVDMPDNPVIFRHRTTIAELTRAFL